MSKLRALKINPNDSVSLSYIKCEPISLKTHPQFNENWLHEKIKEDPKILGLGDLDLRDHERRQPRAGRLDLLLEDAEEKIRYEVEIQLGQTDESHLIRTIEYWDNERKRFPQYDHYAVIIAEDVTTRFLNVIHLFNGHIPLIAIQVKAVRFEDKVSLFFTKVINEIELGYDDEEARQPEKDRNFWEEKASPTTLKLVDEIYSEILKISPGYQLKYNKHYIGFHRDQKAHNFILFKPNKSNIKICMKFKMKDDMVAELEALGIDVFNYNVGWKEHTISLTPEVFKATKSEIVKLIKHAFDNYYE